MTYFSLAHVKCDWKRSSIQNLNLQFAAHRVHVFQSALWESRCTHRRHKERTLLCVSLSQKTCLILDGRLQTRIVSLNMPLQDKHTHLRQNRFFLTVQKYTSSSVLSCLLPFMMLLDLKEAQNTSSNETTPLFRRVTSQKICLFQNKESLIIVLTFHCFFPKQYIDRLLYCHSAVNLQLCYLLLCWKFDRLVRCVKKRSSCPQTQRHCR